MVVVYLSKGHYRILLHNQGKRKKEEKTVKNVESGGTIGQGRGGAEADAQVKRGERASDM